MSKLCISRTAIEVHACKPDIAAAVAIPAATATGNTPTAGKWMDKQDILERLNISARTLQKWRTEGTLRYSQIGGKLYYNETDIENMLCNGRR